MEIFRQIRTFVLESGAFAGLQIRMMKGRALVGVIRPIYRALDLEDGLDEALKEGDRDDTRKFYEDIAHARK